MDFPAIRVLEIGDHHHFKQTFPDRTSLLWTGRRRPKAFAPHDYIDCTPLAFRRAMKQADAGAFDLIIAYAGQRSPWHPRYWLRAMFQHSPLVAATRVFGVAWLQYYKTKIPIVVLDMHDIPTIHASNFFLLDIAHVYCKRELPVDRWQSLYSTAHTNLPTLRIRRDPRWRDRIAKLHPISLQSPLLDLNRSDDDVFSTKTSDVFFAGMITDNSTVRSDGLRQLNKLMSLGLKIDVATERLPLSDFYHRMSRAWLAWSPSGFGWHCYRHYEAPQCLAVPVINYPTVSRHHPLQDGFHAIYYDPEGTGLSDTIQTALLDKERLRRIAVAGRGHVRAHYAGSAFCEYVLRLIFQDGSVSRHDGHSNFGSH